MTEVQFKAEYTLVGRGCSKKLKSCCNDKNRLLINSKECGLRTGVKKNIHIIKMLHGWFGGFYIFRHYYLQNINLCF